MKISFAIAVHNEHEELNRLLQMLFEYKNDIDEIVVQGHQRKVTDSVLQVISRNLKNGVTYCEYPLNDDFATYKNNLLKQCEGEWIFLVDADEYPHEYLLENLHDVLDQADNDGIEMIAVPRINIVDGLTEDWRRKWGWRTDFLDDVGVTAINFPDYQMRLLKNNGKIWWKNKVHEVLDGYKSYSALPAESEWSLIHPKTIERQIKQNEYYQTLS